MLTEIESKWELWKERPFPDGVAGSTYFGIDLVEVDTFSAGCISTFVGNRGRLDHDRIKILRNCSTDLDKALGKLTGEAAEYFQELSEIQHKILDVVSLYE